MKLLYTKKNFIILLIIFVGVLIRILYLNSFPMGVNQDEAYAGYEAYSLLNCGIDSYGYKNPVYLSAWNSGMNALYTYISIPFVALLGLNNIAIRLPQAIIGSILLPIFYLFLKKIKNETVALIGLFLLAINPWHILMCRWGLESNLAPSIIMLGLYFFVLSLEKEKYLILSALFYGLSLYCYATIWIVLPIIIFFQTLYFTFHKKIKINKSFVLSCVVLISIALPLLLFCAVNIGFIDEITGIISIPKLAHFRSSEVNFSLKNVFINFKTMCNIIIYQNDTMPLNQIVEYGLYYKFSIIFIIIGIFSSLKALYLSLKNKTFDLSIIMVFQFIGAFLIGISVSVNVNRINIIHFPILYFCTIGIYNIIKEIKSKELHKNILHVFIFIYSISFVLFATTYFTDYNDNLSEYMQTGSKEAILKSIELKNDIKAEKICITDNINYARILYFTKFPANEINHNYIPERILDKSYFGDLIYSIDYDDIQDNYIYVIPNSDINKFNQLEFNTLIYDNFSVAYK